MPECTCHSGMIGSPAKAGAAGTRKAATAAASGIRRMKNASLGRPQAQTPPAGQNSYVRAARIRRVAAHREPDHCGARTFTTMVADLPPSAPPTRPAACHTTHPNGRTPPGGRPSPTFHGRHGLWTTLPADGVLRITTTRPVPPGQTFSQINPDGSLGTKFPWWGSHAAAPRLTLRAHRLDGPGHPFRLTGA